MSELEKSDRKGEYTCRTEGRVWVIRKWNGKPVTYWLAAVASGEPAAPLSGRTLEEIADKLARRGRRA
jgi:hypothetical protein